MKKVIVGVVDSGLLGSSLVNGVSFISSVQWLAKVNGFYIYDAEDCLDLSDLDDILAEIEAVGDNTLLLLNKNMSKQLGFVKEQWKTLDFVFGKSELFYLRIYENSDYRVVTKGKLVKYLPVN